MAQDPGDEPVENPDALDMVTLPGGSFANESEADVVRGLLEANGIPSLVILAPELPALGFEIKVPRGRVIEAAGLLAQAEAAGPQGAAEAESESER